MQNLIAKLTEGLWKHQKEAVEYCQTANHYGLFMEMGTGKTATAINIMRLWFLRRNKVVNSIVFCPPIVVMQWKDEFHNWSKLGVYVVPLVGTGKKRLEIMKKALESNRPSIFITNYESLLMKPLFSLMMDASIEVGIFDESHKLKNPASKRTKAAIKLSDKMNQKLILTGTPILNSPMDIYSQFRVMDGGKAFGNNFHVFQAKYFVDVNIKLRGTQKYFPNWMPRKGIAGEFHKIIDSNASRVKKEECLDLPPLIRKEVCVELSPEQKRVYKELKKDYISFVEGGVIEASMALVKLLRLQQVVSGFVTYEKTIDSEEIRVEKMEDKIFENVPRLNALHDILEEITPNNKVIVWACFKKNYKQIISVCEKLGIKHVEIFGGQTNKQREKAIDSFRNDPDVKVVIANQQAGGTGLNLIEASYAVYYSRDYRLDSDLQSEARNYRGGSEMHSKVTRIDIKCPGTIDDVILETLKRKQNLSEKIVDGLNLIEHI